MKESISIICMLAILLIFTGCTKSPTQSEPQVELLLKGKKRIFQGGDVIVYQLYNASSDTIWLRICGPVRLTQQTSEGWRDWGPRCVWDGIVISVAPDSSLSGKDGPVGASADRLHGTCRYISDIYRKIVSEDETHFERLPDVISETFFIQK